MKKKAFTIFKRDGVTFIATPDDWRVHIADENGNNYGSWADVQTFHAQMEGNRKMPAGETFIIGKCTISIKPV